MTKRLESDGWEAAAQQQLRDLEARAETAERSLDDLDLEDFITRMARIEDERDQLAGDLAAQRELAAALGAQLVEAEERANRLWDRLRDEIAHGRGRFSRW